MHTLPIITLAANSAVGAATNVAYATGPALIETLLAEQQTLSAVEVFSRQEGAHRFSRSAVYSALLPASPPGPGQQYAFEVDLDRCSGCKACVAACHSLNGLDESESFREVGLMIGGGATLPVVQHVTAACHHCIEPACMIGCPVNAYEKSPTTGIVKHLDDQCIGCQYCTLACPYEVPKYHHAKGIVRKCDMCSSRLAVGEAPACVQSCPHQAISIKVVDRQQVIEDAETATFLPGAPDPAITLPSTTYKSSRNMPRNLLPVDYHRVRVQHPHWALVVMLVLTQLSVGAFGIGLLLNRWIPASQAAALSPLLATNALALGMLALAASTLHLGRPLYAFRAVLGLTHSWLSREIVAFGAFAGFAIAYAGGTWFATGTSQFLLRTVLEELVAISGVVGIFCSAMIYVFTQRELWSFRRVIVRFTLTSLLLGLAAVWFSTLILYVARPSAELDAFISDVGPTLCRALLGVTSFKLLWEGSIFRKLLARRMTALKRSALLLTGELASFSAARFALGALGGIVMPALILNGLNHATANPAQFVVETSMLFIACLAGELLERSLFFSACAAPRMPGGLR